MSVVNEFTLELNDLVRQLMTEDKKYSDSDKRLMARLWSMQVGGAEETKKVTMYDFLIEYQKEDSKFVSQEAAGRARRKIEETTPALRGLTYDERHKGQQAKMKKSLGYEGGKTP